MVQHVMRMAGHNFIHESLPESDRVLFFGPLTEGDVFQTFSDEETMEDLMVRAKKFPSKGQARKNGQGGPIPAGFSSRTIGKGINRMDFFILNKFDGE